LGAHGDLLCLDAKTGKIVWEKDLTKAYKMKTPMWGFSGHPLVDGDTLYCLVGGEGSIAVAFDKDTGEEKWKSLKAKEAGYCPPVMIEKAGVKQLLIWHPESLNGVDPSTGEAIWSHPLKPAYNMSCASPRFQGNRLFVSAIGTLAVMLDLESGWKGVKSVWNGTPKTGVFCSNSTPVWDGDTIYGCDVESSALMAVDAATGKRLWTDKRPVLGKDKAEADARHGTSFLVKNGARYVIFSETGELILAALNREGYQEHGRFQAVEPTNECFGRPVVWTHPAYAEKCAFVRNDKELVCLSLAASDY
ncbi:MAG: PQQ-binding-like beta-propeller repeat protein, partial [Verrucomicrobiota bacterium]